MTTPQRPEERPRDKALAWYRMLAEDKGARVRQWIETVPDSISIYPEAREAAHFAGMVSGLESLVGKRVLVYEAHETPLILDVRMVEKP